MSEDVAVEIEVVGLGVARFAVAVVGDFVGSGGGEYVGLREEGAGDGEGALAYVQDYWGTGVGGYDLMADHGFWKRGCVV